MATVTRSRRARGRERTLRRARGSFPASTEVVVAVGQARSTKEASMSTMMAWLVVWLGRAVEPDGDGQPYPPVPK